MLEIDYLVAHIGSHMGKGTMAGVRNVVGACKRGGCRGAARQDRPPDRDDGGADPQRGIEVRGAEADPRRGEGFGEDGRLSRHLPRLCGGVSTSQAGRRLRGRWSSSRTSLAEEKAQGRSPKRLGGTLGGALDRHDHIGWGQIGEKGFRAFLRHGRVAKLPILMEVPRRRQEEGRGEHEAGQAPHRGLESGVLYTRDWRPVGRLGLSRHALLRLPPPTRTSSGATLSRAWSSRGPRSRHQAL